MLIVVEGIDGSGKSTQARMLYEALLERGYKVSLIYEPTDSEYGEAIRQKLKSGDYTPLELYELFLKDRELNAKRILDLMNKGTIVIMDRYFISTIAYQGAQGIPIDKIVDDHKEMPRPDIIFILDIPPKVALTRIRPRDTFEVLNFLEDVRKIYLRIPEILEAFHCDIYIIDATKTPQEIHREILSRVLEKLG